MKTKVRFREIGKQAWITIICLGTAEEFRNDLEMMSDRKFEVEKIKKVG